MECGSVLLPVSVKEHWERGRRKRSRQPSFWGWVGLMRDASNWGTTYNAARPCVHARRRSFLPSFLPSFPVPISNRATVWWRVVRRELFMTSVAATATARRQPCSYSSSSDQGRIIMDLPHFFPINFFPNLFVGNGYQGTMVLRVHCSIMQV